jgi:uncharacterized repeat protein (TIGR03803 family)
MGLVTPMGPGRMINGFRLRPNCNSIAATIIISLSALLGSSPFGGAFAAGITQLYAFQGAPDDGCLPNAGLVSDSAGNLYGVTPQCGAFGWGAVFKLAPNGAETILHSFTGGSDGGYPPTALIIDAAGNLYGTTECGGAYDGDAGYGVVFKLAPDGTETVLHAFADGNDGEIPEVPLVMDSSGNLYGTTLGGGYGYGTVFSVTPDGYESVLYAFQGGNDGADPGYVVVGTQGNLYGATASGGGTGCGGGGCGTVFELAPGGEKTILHAFKGKDGMGPVVLIAGKKGGLYGETGTGGTSGCGVDKDGCGTVFAITAAGKFKTLHKFAGTDDGYYPYGLILDKTGVLYGTTVGGGGTGCSNEGCGTVFEVTPQGTETVLYAFTGGSSDGWFPFGGVIEMGKNELYGTTEAGGNLNCVSDPDGCGTIYKLKK